MLRCTWTNIHITTNQQANQMINLFQEINPSVGAMDTEADGLHIISSQPFLFQCGFIHPTKNEGYTFIVDIEKQPNLAHAVIKAWLKLAETLDIFLAHNTTFDLHMLKNIGHEYITENLSDTMFYIRHANDARPKRAGGVSLGLKEYATKNIDPNAKHYEKLLKNEQSSIAKEYNLKLKQKLKNYGTPPAKYSAKSYTLSVITDMFKDPIFTVEDLPEEIKQPYLEWINELPLYLQHKVVSLVDAEMISYKHLNRDNLITYAHYDIIYVLEIFLQLDPAIKARKNEIALQIDNSQIFPTFEMERTGFKADKQYIEESKTRLKNYILERRQNLFELAGRELTIGQHALIKQILNDDFNLNVTSTGAFELNQTRSQLVRNNENPTAIEIIDIIQELRTLEKWYSTYLDRFSKELKHHNYIYTTINLVGTISGRVTSDFQQFPKDPILTTEGEELFHPRKMVISTDDKYDAIVYIDYSQIELRFQAMYTILVGYPDINLCRAYMPYKCINKEGVLFDYNNPTHLQNWKGEWFLEEDPSIPWEPIDVHGVMATEISGLQPDQEGFKEARNIGKTTNFAKNYGAKYNRIKMMFPEKTEQEITTIDNAYYNSFPGIKYYQEYCYHRAEYAYTTNLFGVKYYNVSGHNLINLLIQGSAAYFLKLKIRETYDHAKKHNIKSLFQMNIHDELSWKRHIDDTDIFYDFKQIMEDWPDTLIPIVADISATKTSWADKKEVNTLNDLQLYLSS